jgi:hypothetical protein
MGERLERLARFGHSRVHPFIQIDIHQHHNTSWSLTDSRLALADRELHHINKKGRPVSQCQHCRSQRKSRSMHHSCDCGKASHKCKHLLEVVDGHKGELYRETDDDWPLGLTCLRPPESCCCNHGDPCTCHLTKREPLLDTVPESDESDHEESGLSRMSSKQSSHDGRRRANTDASLTFDEQGRHKPIHKHIRAHEACGPYQWVRTHSSHDTARLTNRSVEDLASADIGGLGLGLRATRSENASPSPQQSGPAGIPVTGNNPSPLDLSGIQYESYASDGVVDFFGSTTPELCFSAGLSAPPVDWSNYEGLDFASKAADEDNFAPSNYSQAQSFGTWDAIGSEQPPTLTTTTSNSGTVSEAGELIANGVFALSSSLRSSTGSLPLELGQGPGDADFPEQNLGDIDFEQFRFDGLPVSTDKLPTTSFPIDPVSTVLDETSFLGSGLPLENAANAFTTLNGQNAFWISDPSMPAWEENL